MKKPRKARKLKGAERMNDIKVLVACEESQRVCVAFRKRGFEAYSCDIIEPSGGYPEWHILGDALKAIEGGTIMTMDGVTHNIGKWNLIIAHPPCTFLTNAAACRLYPHKGQLNTKRYLMGLEAKQMFVDIFCAPCEHIAIENPIPSKVFELPKYTQMIQPYEYGHPYSKKTCVWLKNLPKLKPTNILPDYKPYVSCGTSKNKGNKEKAGVSRAGGAAKIRSKTFEGIAEAMAEQWGGYVANEKPAGNQPPKVF